jgi:hypothetical protein
MGVTTRGGRTTRPSCAAPAGETAGRSRAADICQREAATAVVTTADHRDLARSRPDEPGMSLCPETVHRALYMAAEKRRALAGRGHSGQVDTAASG